MAKVLRITAKRDGFRRGGLSHPATPTDHAVDNLTEDQVEQLKAEPMLVVEEVELKEEAKPQGGKASGAKANETKPGGK